MESSEGRLSIADRSLGRHDHSHDSGQVTVWYQTYLVTLTKLLVPTIVVLVSVSLPACCLEVTRSSFRIVNLDIQQESYKKALTLLGQLPETGQSDVAQRAAATAAFSVSPWGWCVESENQEWVLFAIDCSL